MNDVHKIYIKGHCGNKEMYEYLQQKYKAGMPYAPGATPATKWVVEEDSQ